MAPGATAQRWLVIAALAAVPGVLVLGFGHRGVHAARSMLVPGAGLVEGAPLLAAVFLAATVAATVAWLRWGVDWSVVVVVVAAMAASAAWGTAAHGTTAVVVRSPSAHEFPLVLLLAGLVGWVRTALAGVPGFRWLAGRRAAVGSTGELPGLPPRRPVSGGLVPGAGRCRRRGRGHCGAPPGCVATGPSGRPGRPWTAGR